MSVALAIVAMSWMVAGSRALASGASDKAEILALNKRIADAIGKKDLNAVMACYVDDKDIVFFEDTIPFQFKGTSTVRNYIQDLFANASQIHDGIEEMSIVVSGDLAAAHYILPVSWTDKSGVHSERGRYTQVLKKVNGKWLIWHEHFSVPYDPTTGKAVLEAKP
jgi:ketosteroid isomerase-like protein